jgi:signal transduction histidine kinase
VGLKRTALIAAIAVVYFVAGKAGLYFSSFSPSSSAVWPATGIAFAALILFGVQVWPAITVGAFLVNLTNSGTIFPSLGMATGNTLEAVVSVYLTMRFAHGRKVFDASQDLFKFVAFSVFASAISATFGVASLVLGGLARFEDLMRIWQTWWVGDIGGFLVVAPVIILLIDHPRPTADRQQTFEFWLMLATISLVSLLAFGGAVPALRDYPIGFFCIPILVWAAFRFGQREAALTTFILAASADWGMRHGLGPWARFSDPLRSVIVPQAFINTMATMTLAMAAVVWERKRAEARANEANRAKDLFLAMLGHELRNPIAALTGAANLLERDDVKSVKSERLLEIVVRQSGHLARMVDDLLDVGRLTAGRIPLDRQPMNLGQCGRDCVATLGVRTKYAARNIALQIEDVWIDGDPDRIAQILVNLLSNALNHTRHDGKVVLTIRAEGDQALIQVEDDGEGISPDLLPRIFDLFVRAERGDDRLRGGLGIGLTLVRRLAELHGGRVEAHSAGRSAGSAFKVLIPRIEAVRKTVATPNGTPKTRVPRRVLIVEDNTDVRESLRTLLELAGHKIFEADSGLSGVQCALANQPDVALIDIGLPGIDGYEVARRIRSASEAQGMMLIALTGYGLPEDRFRAKQAGFDAHLVKPVNLNRLADLLTVDRSPLQ